MLSLSVPRSAIRTLTIAQLLAGGVALTGCRPVIVEQIIIEERISESMTFENATPQEGPIPTANAENPALPEIVSYDAPEDVRKGQVFTVRLYTNAAAADAVTGAVVHVVGATTWYEVANTVPLHVSEAGAPGPYYMDVVGFIDPEFADADGTEVAIEFALIGAEGMGGAVGGGFVTRDNHGEVANYEVWDMAVTEDEAPVCPLEADCSDVICGNDPICGVECGTCAPGGVCSFDGASCLPPGDACPDAQDCQDHVCGLDPQCGTLNCGSCEAGFECNFEGQCEAPPDLTGSGGDGDSSTGGDGDTTGTSTTGVDPVCPTGELGCDCFPNSTCYAGLACQGGVCVAAGDGDGDGDGDGTTAAMGDGDGDGDGSTGTVGTTAAMGDGDGDGDGTTGMVGDGDGTTAVMGDGDGDGTTSTVGDGDGDGTTAAMGDGDGDGTTGTVGDGDGDGTSGMITSGSTGTGDIGDGDGDGATGGIGDGDGDGTTGGFGDGDGDGSTGVVGDGDGDGSTGGECEIDSDCAEGEICEFNACVAIGDGDGDGDGSTGGLGDGDGDGTTGGDGDGDGTTGGDGDGTTGGDGDGDGTTGGDAGEVNLIFVTTNTYSIGTAQGQFNSATAAGDLCKQEAINAGIADAASNWVAWLSSSTQSAAQRIVGASGWARVDGRHVGNATTQLNNRGFWYSPGQDAFGADVGGDGLIWTGLTVSGGIDQNCSGWSDNLASASATVGQTLSDSTINRSASVQCDGAYRLMCLQVDHMVTLDQPTPPQNARYAFSTTFQQGGATADFAGACQIAAEEAGLATQGTPVFYPLIVDDDLVGDPLTATPLDPLVLDGTPWIRPDNYAEIFPDPTNLDGGGQLLRSMNVRWVGGWAATGNDNYGWPTALNQTSDATSTCQFMTGLGAAPWGHPDRRDIQWRHDASLTSVSCGNGGGVYCLQQ